MVFFEQFKLIGKLPAAMRERFVRRPISLFLGKFSLLRAINFPVIPRKQFVLEPSKILVTVRFQCIIPARFSNFLCFFPVNRKMGLETAFGRLPAPPNKSKTYAEFSHSRWTRVELMFRRAGFRASRSRCPR